MPSAIELRVPRRGVGDGNVDTRGGELDKECARRRMLPPWGEVGTTFVAADEDEDDGVDKDSLVVAVLGAVDDGDEEKESSEIPRCCC